MPKINIENYKDNCKNCLAQAPTFICLLSNFLFSSRIRACPAPQDLSEKRWGDFSPQHGLLTSKSTCVWFSLLLPLPLRLRGDTEQCHGVRWLEAPFGSLSHEALPGHTGVKTASVACSFLWILESKGYHWPWFIGSVLHGRSSLEYLPVHSRLSGALLSHPISKHTDLLPWSRRGFTHLTPWLCIVEGVFLYSFVLSSSCLTSLGIY